MGVTVIIYLLVSYFLKVLVLQAQESVKYLTKQNESIMLNNTFEKNEAFLLFERCTLICCSGVILPVHVCVSSTFHFNCTNYLCRFY